MGLHPPPFPDTLWRGTLRTRDNYGEWIWIWTRAYACRLLRHSSPMPPHLPQAEGERFTVTQIFAFWWILVSFADAFTLMTSHPTVRRRLNLRGAGDDDEDKGGSVEDLIVFTGIIQLVGGLSEVWLYWKCLTQNLSKTGPFRREDRAPQSFDTASLCFTPVLPLRRFQFRFSTSSIAITSSLGRSVRFRESGCSVTTRTLVSKSGKYKLWPLFFSCFLLSMPCPTRHRSCWPGSPDHRLPANHLPPCRQPCRSQGRHRCQARWLSDG